MSTCYKTSNNKYFGCPPRMADGRHFTDYRPSCDVNSTIQMDNKIKNSFEYRNFLQQNAEKLANINRKFACEQNCCSPCKEPFANTTMLPEKYKVECNEDTCTRVLNDINGLGDGRVYFNSPRTCNGLPAVWPSNKKTNSCSNPYDNFMYYGPVESSKKVQRNTVPKGGEALSGGDRTVNM